MHRPAPRGRTRLPFRFHAVAVAITAASAATTLPLSAIAQAPATDATRDYDLPAGSLATTLNRIAVDAGITLSVDSALVRGKESHPVRGEFDPETALREALRGSGLELTRTAAGTLTLRSATQGAVTLR